jgi:hypothetical protein
MTLISSDWINILHFKLMPFLNVAFPWIIWFVFDFYIEVRVFVCWYLMTINNRIIMKILINSFSYAMTNIIKVYSEQSKQNKQSQSLINQIWINRKRLRWCEHLKISKKLTLITRSLGEWISILNLVFIFILGFL